MRGWRDIYRTKLDGEKLVYLHWGFRAATLPYCIRYLLSTSTASLFEHCVFFQVYCRVSPDIPAVWLLDCRQLGIGHLFFKKDLVQGKSCMSCLKDPQALLTDFLSLASVL